MKKFESILCCFYLILFILSCQTGKYIFQNYDFEKVKKHNEVFTLGELLMKIDFKEANINKDVFYANGYVFDKEDLEKLSGVSISIEKESKEKKVLYETKEDGYFEIKIDNFSKYEILRFSLMGYVMEYYEISTLLKEKGILK